MSGIDIYSIQVVGITTSTLSTYLFWCTGYQKGIKREFSRISGQGELI